MIFAPLTLSNAFRIDLDKKEDNRGFFARVFCERESLNIGIKFSCVQINTSYSKVKGTLRGLHFQREPKLEAKIVKCIKGSIADVIVDLRKDSPTFGKWEILELSEDNRSMIYVPEGFAHGFQTLTNDCELLYLHSEYYSPEYEGGVIYNDVDLDINWPLLPTEITSRDLGHPTLKNTIPLISTFSL